MWAKSSTADNFWQNMQSMFSQKTLNRKIPIQGSLHNLGALTTLGLCSMKFIIQWLGLRSHPPYTSHVLSSSQWSLPWKPFEFSTPSPNTGAIPQGSFQTFINYFAFHWYLIVLEIVTILEKYIQLYLYPKKSNSYELHFIHLFYW